MVILESILTAQTCGEACWYAREDVCRCSCNGANHACLRGASGEQPTRTCRILDHVYRLVAVTNYCEGEGIVRRVEDAARTVGIEARWNYKNRGALAVRKCSTASQVERWPELASCRDIPRYQLKADNLVWVRLDVADAINTEDAVNQARLDHERFESDRAERLAKYA